MELLETLKRKIDSANDMHSVVKTMESLAAVNIRLYERAAESVSEYSRTVELGLQIVMRNMAGDSPARPTEDVRRYGVIVFGAAQGLSGDFNEKILSFALEKLEELGIGRDNRSIMALGDRIIAALAANGDEVEHKLPMSGSFADITPTVQEMLIAIQHWRQEKDIESVIIFHSKRMPGASYEQEMVRLFPLDAEWLRDLRYREWESRSVPMFTMNWNQLFSSLVSQYFSVTLYRAAFESLEAENASRLASMQAAEKNIEERLEELKTNFNRQRQASITSELLDIVAGFEALTGKQR
jgi:F-type H+-transporting ATPase subunit gamma